MFHSRLRNRDYRLPAYRVQERRPGCFAVTSPAGASSFRKTYAASGPDTLPHIALLGYDAAFMTTKPSPRPPNLREKSQLMSASEIERTLVRLVHEIIEKNNGAAELGLVGIRRQEHHPGR